MVILAVFLDHREAPNQFYQIEEIEKPIISKEANIQLLYLKTSYLYDMMTEKGRTYTFYIK